MKVTKSYIKRIIKEELAQVIKEFDLDAFDSDTGAGESQEDIDKREREEDFADYMKMLFGAFHNIATNEKAAVIAAMNLQRQPELFKSFNIVYKLLSQVVQGNTNVGLQKVDEGSIKCPEGDAFEECARAKIKEFYSVDPLFSKLGGAIEKLDYDFSDSFRDSSSGPYYGNGFMAVSKIAPDDGTKQQKIYEYFNKNVKNIYEFMSRGGFNPSNYAGGDVRYIEGGMSKRGEM